MAEIQYNGVKIRFPQINAITFTPIFDDEGRIVQYVNVEFNASGWVYTDSGGAQQTDVSDKTLNLMTLIAKLSQPRREFRWYERGGEGFPILEILPTTDVNNLRTTSGVTGTPSNVKVMGQDINFGPKVIPSVIDQWPGVFAVSIVMTAQLHPTIVGAISPEIWSGAKKGNPVISHVSSVTYAIDQNHYTIRTTEGLITYRSTVREDADTFRADIFAAGVLGANAGTDNSFTKGIPLPSNFIRVGVTYNIPMKRNVLKYVVVDREVYKTPPPPASMIELQIEVEATGYSSISFNKRMTGVIQGNRQTSKSELLTVVLNLLQRHIMTAPLVYTYHQRLVDWPYENRVAFDFAAIQSPGLAFATFKQAGIFIEPYTTGKHFFQDLRGTGKLSGSGYNLGTPAKTQAPPSVVLAVEQAIKERRDKLAEELKKSYRKQASGNKEPGVIEHLETITLKLVERDATTRPTGTIGSDGKITSGGSKGERSSIPDLYITVVGIKMKLVNTATGRTPLGPDPKKIWNDNDDARERAQKALISGTEKNVLVTGRVIYFSNNEATRVVSKYGSYDLHTLTYRYIVLLEPALTKKLLKNLSGGTGTRPLLEGVTSNKLLATGVRQKLTNMLISNVRGGEEEP